MSGSNGYTVSTTLKANTSKFKSEIESAIKKIEKFDKIVSKIKDIELKANDKQLQSKIKHVEHSLNQLEHKNPTVNLNTDTKPVTYKLKRVSATLSKLNSTKVESMIDVKDSNSNVKLQRMQWAMSRLNHMKSTGIIDLSDKLFLTKVANVKNTLNQLNNKEVKTRVEVSTSASIARVVIFKKMLKSIPNKIKVKTDVDTNVLSKALDGLNQRTDVFNNRMEKLAHSIKTFGTIGGNIIRGSLLTSFTSLIPIVASVIPIITLLGNSIAVIGGGVLGLVGAFGLASAGVIGFAAMAKSAISMLNQGLIQTSSATIAYVNSLSELKRTWQSIITMNSDSIFNAMSSGLQILTNALNQLRPFIRGVSRSIELSMQKFQSWINVSDTANKAFNTLNTDGIKVFNSILKAAGKFGDGLVNILTQFSPLFVYVAKGLEMLSEKFQIWSTKVSTAEGINQFINFIKVNLPLIGKIFADTFVGMINIFKAFGSNSGTLLSAISELSGKFRVWSQNLAQSQGFKNFITYINENAPVLVSLVSNIARALLSFISAMAPIGSIVINVLNAVAGFIAQLFEMHPAVAQMIGVITMFSGMLMSLSPIITALITYMVPLINKLNILKVVFSIVRTVASMLVQGIALIATALSSLSAPVLIIIGSIAALIAIFIYLWKTNESFRNKVIEIWNMIKDIFLTVVDAIVSFIKSVWGTLVSWWQQNNQLIMDTVMIIWNEISAYITTIINIIVAIIKSGWDIVVTIIQTVWTVITTIIQTAISVVLNIITFVMQVITGNWSGAWQTILDIGRTVWNGIVSIATTIWNGLKSILAAIWNGIVSIARVLWDYLKETIFEKIKASYNIVRDTAQQIWQVISSKFQEVVSAVRDKMSQIYNAIKDKVSSSLSAVKSFTTDFFNAGMDLIRVLINGVGNMAQSLVDKVKGVVGSAIDTAKNLLGIKSPSRVFKSIGAYTMLGLIIGVNSESSSVISNISNIAERMQSAFNPRLNAPVIGDVTGDLSQIGGELRTMVQHNHTIESNPNMKTVRIEMAIDNEALTSIVNDVNATNHSIFEF
ncbi:hypothetical protein E3S84_03580 [Staphylococcus aureus]|uniref:phage tail protein n=2 Tax=Staphylococcus aureus TaxID=1280 RepID=UPI0013634C18|nr:hypothetical protein [Staphylococcus aureus]QHL16416.1 hypothetical protein E3S84_03580 [Staphylococcus aureus]